LVPSTTKFSSQKDRKSQLGSRGYRPGLELASELVPVLESARLAWTSLAAQLTHCCRVRYLGDKLCVGFLKCHCKVLGSLLLH